MDANKPELEATHSWFPKVDRVSGQDTVSAFKRRARLHQALWRELHGLPRGTHPGSIGPVDNGSKLGVLEGLSLSDDFRNFLPSERIREAVTFRTGNREKGQQIKPDRLRRDLLSSMPMCFNLFGELHDDPVRLTAAGKALFGVEGPGLSVRFEHSPGRQSPDYTNDGTAFDVALFFANPDGSETVIGIETKYHEHAVKEAEPDKLTPKRPTVRRPKMPTYRAIASWAQEQGIFKPGWEKVLGTELQQIWRDHLLLLSMLKNPDDNTSAGQYVLVHPEQNPAFHEAGKRYRDDVLEDDATFRVMTVEELLKPHVLHEPGTEKAFRERYLW